MEPNQKLEQICHAVIGLAIEVHRQLGPGLLESAYQQCLFYEIKKAGFKVEQEIILPIVYKEITLNHGYRIDLLVEDQLVIELKAIEDLSSVHSAQILTYLKLGNYPLGILINYNCKILRNSIKRFINSTAI